MKLRLTVSNPQVPRLSLYSSIPVDGTLELLEVWLLAQDLSQEEQDMYHEMTTVCMSQNYFQFDSK